MPASHDGLTWLVRMATERQSTYTGLVEDRNLLTPGFLMASDDPVVLAAAQAVGRRNGTGAAAIRPWQFATDGGWSCGVFGIPTVGFAPGEERYAHTNRERIDIEEARWGFERYPDLIAAIQKALEA
jgi:acetylornithine deacetylase/succinyl-diaminopimelate desuccinylase-like protein